MLAALYGELVSHAWHDPEHDAYQLFHQRSIAMGRLDDRAAAEDRTYAAPGLWALNDAGWGHPLATPGTELGDLAGPADVPPAAVRGRSLERPAPARHGAARRTRGMAV